MVVGSPAKVKAIHLGEDERMAKKFNPETLAKALSGMHEDGVVVLKNVIPVEEIDKINAWICEDAERRLKDPSQKYNHGVKSNFLQRPPITDEKYLTEDVYFNPFILQLANAHLGPRPVWNWLTCNNALAGTGGKRQPVHKDSSFEHPLFPYYFIANIPLCDFKIENGATEVWPGSHLHTTTRDQKPALTEEDIKTYPMSHIGGFLPPVTDEAVEQRRKASPPTQAICSKGDVMIRDIRLWHAGMPNNSDDHRAMIGLGYQSPYHPNYTLQTHLPLSQRKFFLGGGSDKLEVRAQWYTDEDLMETEEDTVFYTEADYCVGKTDLFI